MHATITPATLAFDPDGHPYSPFFDDVYHTTSGGLGQAQQVFLACNGLPSRWAGRAAFTIVETGFGLGLNFLATWAAWRADPARSRRLHFISIEKHPFRVDDLARLQAAWPELAELSAGLRRQWPALLPGVHRLGFDDGRVTLDLVFGDAVQALPLVEARADAFYLDGFSPACNPDMWSPAVFAQLARLAAPGASLATWSVAGEVRRGLQAVGFAVERRPGFGGKRQMLAGRFEGAAPSPEAPAERRALVIGAGVAGSSVAERLAARGWQVVVVDEAYIDFSENAKSVIDLAATTPDMLVLRTMSKLYGMAGTRFGYAIGTPDVLKGLRHFGVNSLSVVSMSAAIASLNDPDVIPSRRALNKKTREETVAFLNKLGYKTTRSESNCFLVDVKRPAREFQDDMSTWGVMVGRSWPGFPNQSRITIGSPEEMARFREAFAKVAKGQKGPLPVPPPFKLGMVEGGMMVKDGVIVGFA